MRSGPSTWAPPPVLAPTLSLSAINLLHPPLQSQQTPTSHDVTITASHSSVLVTEATPTASLPAHLSVGSSESLSISAPLIAGAPSLPAPIGHTVPPSLSSQSLSTSLSDGASSAAPLSRTAPSLTEEQLAKRRKFAYVPLF